MKRATFRTYTLIPHIAAVALGGDPLKPWPRRLGFALVTNSTG